MTKIKNDWQTLPVLPIFPRTYLDFAAEQGLDPAELLRAAGLPVELAQQAEPHLTLEPFSQLVAILIARLGNDSIGVDIGMRLPPTAYGNLGYALLCSETLGDAAQLLNHYWHLFGRVINATLSVEEPWCTVTLEHFQSFPLLMQRISLESTMASIHRGFKLLVNAADSDLEFAFNLPQPPYADKLRARLGHVLFDQPVNQFRFRHELLQMPLPMHNPTGLKFAIDQCERESLLASNERLLLKERVREDIHFSAHGGYPTMDEISDKMNMTARTLRRRLEEEGTTYKRLLEEAKRRDAIKLLDDRHMEIQRIAELLGYQDPANFTRAFRQWTGQSPSQYRETRSSNG